MGKRTGQKDITIDTTSDSQVNSNFLNKWSNIQMVFAYDNFINRYKRTSATVLRERINIQIWEGGGQNIIAIIF